MRDYLLPNTTKDEKEYNKQRDGETPIRVRVGNTHLAEAVEADTYRAKAIRCARGRAGTRSAVSAFSEESKRRAMWTFEDVLSGIHWDSLLTLTYHNPPENGLQCKQQLKRLFEHLIRDRKNPHLKAFWWLEFQKRGAAHFHIVVSNLELFVKEGPGETKGTHFYLPKHEWVFCKSSIALSQEWARVANQIDEYTILHCANWQKVKAPKALGAYLAKYVRKKEQKEVPKWFESVGRFWGVRGCADEKTAARGKPVVYVPKSLLAYAEKADGTGALPYTYQWRKAEVIKQWLLTDEGIAYQDEAKLLRHEPYYPSAGSMRREDIT